MRIETKLPKVGTTIFTVMSQLAAQHKAVNLGQGFPDFEGPELMREALNRAMHAGKNQYAPMAGIPKLREQIALKTKALYGCAINVDTEVTVTSGATEALFCAIAAIVRPGESVIVLDPCYDSYEPAIELNGGKAIHVPLDSETFSVDWQRVNDAVEKGTRAGQRIEGADDFLDRRQRESVPVEDVKAPAHQLVVVTLLSDDDTPIEGMPDWIRPFRLDNPVRHFATNSRGVLLKGAGLDVLYPHLLALVAAAVLLVGISAWRFRKQFG